MGSRPTLILLVAAISLAVLIPALAAAVTDVWWYESVGYADVLWRRIAAEVGLGLAGGLVALAITGGALLAIERAAPRPPPEPPGPRAVDARELEEPAPVAPDPSGRIARLGVLLCVLASASVSAGAWQDLVLFLHRVPFGRTDPVWGLDVGFYLFTLPLLSGAASLLTRAFAVAGAIVLGLLVSRGALKLAVAEHEGGVVATGLVLPEPVRRPLAVVAAGFLLSVAVGAWLRRYTAMYEPGRLFDGPGWVELHVTMPLLLVEAVTLAVCAFAAFVWIGRGRLASALTAVAAVPALFVLTEAALPRLVHAVVVAPSELSREAPQIASHLEATRAAWRLDRVVERELPGTEPLDRDALDRNRATLDSVRLWDHEPLLAAFSQVQEIRTYYGFVSVDNDRYLVGGRPRQILLSPRELQIGSLPDEARTWVNETLTYTHGYGLALGPVNEVTGEGLPRLWVRDIPPRVDGPAADLLEIRRPEIYFGEATDHVVVVGADAPEFDYPSGDENAYARYQGADGVRLGVLGRLLFAIRLGSPAILLSRDLRPDSRVLMRRDVVERVRAIAPFLRYDDDPYLVVHRGRLVWVLDAYATASSYPYAEAVAGIGNYARSAAKVTVDAYDGTVLYWRADPEDPLTSAWSDAFPGLFQPLEEMADDLQAHLRYPQDLFAAQADLFATYHMQDPKVFYNREDQWEVPAVGETRMAPYFTVLRLPEAGTTEEFIQMLPFSPRGKPNLAAWMAARSDAPHLGELVVYKFPKDTMVYGPRMVVARINQDDEISEKISLWDQQGSQVQLGTLLVVPIERSLLYVQPLYLRAEQSSIPELKRVIVAYEDRIAMRPTLDEALDALLGGAPAAPAATAPLAEDEAARLRRAEAVWAGLRASAAAGDWAAWARGMVELEELLGSPPPATH